MNAANRKGYPLIALLLLISLVSILLSLLQPIFQLRVLRDDLDFSSWTTELAVIVLLFCSPFVGGGVGLSIYGRWLDILPGAVVGAIVGVAIAPLLIVFVGNWLLATIVTLVGCILLLGIALAYRLLNFRR